MAPGVVERLTTRAADGTEIGSWLVRPADVSADRPAPLVVWVHGGPLGSWNGWHWRWNPHLLAAHGYAVLMPDPALSTGYGQRMVDRGWNDWGGTPYADVTAAVDAALAGRSDLDASRTALMGGSYGGYMINWIAGQTDRFKALVSHDGVFDLVSMYGSTEELWFPEWDHHGTPWENPEGYEKQNPLNFVKNWKTPALVIHGERDYRCPIGEGLNLFEALQYHGVPSELMIFPDENHWILKPQNSLYWYGEVRAWLTRYAPPAPSPTP